MKKTKVLFTIWGIIVVIIIGLLTTLGFMLKKVNREYRVLENTLKVSAEKYTSDKFLFPNEGESIIVTKDELLEKEFLDEDLKIDNDVCDGYVVVKTDKVVKYKAYIKCQKYTTDGYNKKD